MALLLLLALWFGLSHPQLSPDSLRDDDVVQDSETGTGTGG